MKCTWKDCTNKAEHTLKDKNDIPWANLCKEHFEKHDNDIEIAIKTPNKHNMKKMLSDWVKAQGGAKMAAKRHF